MSALMALLGSGEFEPWTEELDRWLLERASGDGSVLILPLASAPEGDEVFDRWANMGLDHYRSLEVPAEVLPLKSREGAERAEFAARLDTASMAYFSGGNPAYLAGALAGSRFWAELRAAMRRGLGYVGCSAGMSCLGEVAPDSSIRDFSSHEVWKPGLKHFPSLILAPHWDALNRYVPGLRELFVAAVPPGYRLLAIDERTAIAGDGTNWRVMGSGGAYLFEDGAWQAFPSGEGFTATLPPAEEASSPA